MFKSIKINMIKKKVLDLLGDNIEIVDSGELILVKIKNKNFEVSVQDIRVVFEVEEASNEQS